MTEEGNRSPSQPNIQPDYWVQVPADNRYASTARADTIATEVYPDAGTVSGTIDAYWSAETSRALAGPGGSPELLHHRPGSRAFFIDFPTFDLEPAAHISVGYTEPGADSLRDDFQALNLKPWLNVNTATTRWRAIATLGTRSGSR